MKHLIGSFLPELKDATVDGTPETRLEGYYAVAPTDAIRLQNPGTFDYLVEVLDAAQAAQDGPSTSTYTNISRASAQMRHGIDLGRALSSGDVAKAEEMLRRSIEGMDSGDSFVLPTSWHAGICTDGDVSCHGHAVVFEFERESDGEVQIRIYNLGSGANFHASTWTQPPPLLSPLPLASSSPCSYPNLLSPPNACSRPATTPPRCLGR